MITRLQAMDYDRLIASCQAEKKIVADVKVAEMQALESDDEDSLLWLQGLYLDVFGRYPDYLEV